jgi:hypothetical protein
MVTAGHVQSGSDATGASDAGGTTTGLKGSEQYAGISEVIEMGTLMTGFVGPILSGC